MKYLPLLIATIATLFFYACNDDHNTEEHSHSNEAHEHGDGTTHVHEHGDHDKNATNIEQEEFEVATDTSRKGITSSF